MFVVKIGGSILEHFEHLVQDLAKYDNFALVHGIGPQVNELTRKELGRKPRWVTSVKGIQSRYTDQDTLKVFVKASRALNKQIVEQLRSEGVNAVGIEDYEEVLVQAKRKERIKVIENGRKKFLDGDYTGKILSINTELVQTLLDQGKIPVIPPFAVGENNQLLNINGDRAAAFFAKELGAEILINLSNIPGVLKSLESEEVIPQIKLNEIESYMEQVSGGMIMKLYGAKEALEFGIPKIVIASGTVDNPISSAMEGKGTVFLQ